MPTRYLTQKKIYLPEVAVFLKTGHPLFSDFATAMAATTEPKWIEQQETVQKSEFK